MPKKKKGKVVQMLSPENYIRKLARGLPLYECWINEGWNENQLAHIIVARQHTNQNYTVGIYLADLNCLGVKDTQFFFNIPHFEYRELVDETRERIGVVKESYILVHNIIYASLEYAEELGFQPHKDFALTEHILEEDTDDIELIEIECGYKGKPLYMRGPLDSDLRSSQIIAQLDKAVGPGNYGVADSLRGYEQDDEGDFRDSEFPFDDDDSEDGHLYDYDEGDIPNSKTFQFKIQIKGITNPPVWRRITVPSYFRFSDFHHLIQFVFNWDNVHLFQFSPGGYHSFPVIEDLSTDGMGDSFFAGDRLEAGEVLLSDIFFEEKQKYTYIYDFGDDWTHTITLEKITPEVAMVPALLAGKGQCPPEDCGGAWGYENLKKILSDPEDPEYEEMRDWLGLEEDESWDPNEFNIKEEQAMLAQAYASQLKDGNQ